jgi:hypothetical protein
MEISIAIADRSARLEAVSEARRVVDRIKAMLEKAESKKSLASVKAEDERLAHIEFLAETAKSRPPESAPLSPARRALADACEELAAAQAAFEIAQSNRAKADADLALAVQKVDAAINALFARDLSKRIAAAQRSHDEFMAQALVLDEVAPDSANLPEATARELRLMRLEAENLLHYDAKAVQQVRGGRRGLRCVTIATLRYRRIEGRAYRAGRGS